MESLDILSRITELRRQLEQIMMGKADLTDPEVIAKSRQIDELTVRYARLTGKDPTLHSGGEKNA